MLSKQGLHNERACGSDLSGAFTRGLIQDFDRGSNQDRAFIQRSGGPPETDSQCPT